MKHTFMWEECTMNHTNVGTNLSHGFEPGSGPFFLYAFLTVMLAALLYTAYRLLVKSKPRQVKAFVLLTASFGLHIPAFYHLLRCVTENFGGGWQIWPEWRSEAFGTAGLFWAAAMFCLLWAVKALAGRDQD